MQACSAGIAATCGLLLESTYASEAASFAIQGKAQDLITLVWVIPLYGVVLHRLKNGSAAARMAWLGVLPYFTYTYLLASVGLAHNRLFLLYVAIYGTSLALLVSGVSSVSTADPAYPVLIRLPTPCDRGLHAGARFDARHPVARGHSAFTRDRDTAGTAE